MAERSSAIAASNCRTSSSVYVSTGWCGSRDPVDVLTDVARHQALTLRVDWARN
jgi:hypothetical protein